MRIKWKMLGQDMVDIFTDEEEGFKWMKILTANKVWFDVDFPA